MDERNEDNRFVLREAHAFALVAGTAVFDAVADDALQGLGEGVTGIFALPEPDEPWDELENSPDLSVPTPPTGSNAPPPPPQPRRKFPTHFRVGQDGDARVEFPYPPEILLEDVFTNALMPSDEAVAAQAGDFECWALSSYLAIEKEHALGVQRQQD